MARLQLDLSETSNDVIEKLMRLCDLKTKKDVVESALFLLGWAASEAHKGRDVAAVDEERKIYMTIVHQALQAAKAAGERFRQEVSGSVPKNLTPENLTDDTRENLLPEEQSLAEELFGQMVGKRGRQVQQLTTEEQKSAVKIFSELTGMSTSTAPHSSAVKFYEKLRHWKSNPAKGKRPFPPSGGVDSFDNYTGKSVDISSLKEIVDSLTKYYELNLTNEQRAFVARAQLDALAKRRTMPSPQETYGHSSSGGSKAG